jgi:NAD-dependent deacetylase
VTAPGDGPRAVASAAESVAALLRGAQRAVVLTGAGISVPSGIPDFRSPGTGLWENVDPMEVAHIDAWRRDPDRFWSFYGQRFASLVDKQPNDAHLAVAELERRGLVRAVIASPGPSA